MTTMRRSIIATATALLLAAAATEATACTGITLKAADGACIPARTIEWGGSDLKSRYVIVPRGYTQRSYVPGGVKEGMEFTAKYGYVGLAVEQEEFVAEGLNEAGLSVLCSAGDFDALITGDMDAQVERALVDHAALPRVELLVAGHHGAADSTSSALLHALKPQVVVITVRADNSYGHPSPEVLERFKELGVRVWETGRAGAVTVRIDQGKIEIRGFLPE